jgi:hypothetical protein
MRKIAGLIAAVVVGCGGSDAGDIANGGDAGVGDAATNDSSIADAGTNDGSASDGATANDAGTDSGTFSVSSVSNLVLWLEGNLASSITTAIPDAGASPTVTVWADQSSHHNDAKGLTAALIRNPTVKANAIHSLAALHFNKEGASPTVGNMLTIANNADNSLQWGTGDFYVAIVGDFDNDPGGAANETVGNFFSKAATVSAAIVGPSFYGNVPGNGTPTTGLTFYTEVAVGDGVTTTTAYNDSTPHVFVIRRQGGTLDLLVDGTSVASTTPAATVDEDNSNAVRIGADGDATLLRLDGDIGEIIAVKDVLSASDQSHIEAYLRAKWGTP